MEGGARESGAVHERGSASGADPDPKRQRVEHKSVDAESEEEALIRQLQERCERLESLLAGVSRAAEAEQLRSREMLEELQIEVIMLRNRLPSSQQSASTQTQESADLASGEVDQRRAQQEPEAGNGTRSDDEDPDSSRISSDSSRDGSRFAESSGSSWDESGRDAEANPTSSAADGGDDDDVIPATRAGL
jgi:hypothetical protein